MKLDYYIYFQIISLLLAMINYRRLKIYKLGALVFLIFIACIVEIAGFELKQHKEVNYLIYNFYLVFSTPVQLLLFYKMLQLNQLQQKIFIGTGFLLMLFVLIDFYFLQGVNAFNTYSLVLIMFLNIIFSVLVLFKSFLVDEITTNFFRHPYLWINAGILIFSLGTLVMLGLQQYIEINKIVINNKNAYRQVMPVLNVILYSAYSYAFLLCRQTSSLQ
jgi:hypothetical protein